LFFFSPVHHSFNAELLKKNQGSFPLPPNKQWELRRPFVFPVCEKSAMNLLFFPTFPRLRVPMDQFFSTIFFSLWIVPNAIRLLPTAFAVFLPVTHRLLMSPSLCVMASILLPSPLPVRGSEWSCNLSRPFSPFCVFQRAF